MERYDMKHYDRKRYDLCQLLYALYNVCSCMGNQSTAGGYKNFLQNIRAVTWRSHYSIYLTENDKAYYEYTVYTGWGEDKNLLNRVTVRGIHTIMVGVHYAKDMYMADRIHADNDFQVNKYHERIDVNRQYLITSWDMDHSPNKFSSMERYKLLRSMDVLGNPYTDPPGRNTEILKRVETVNGGTALVWGNALV